MTLDKSTLRAAREYADKEGLVVLDPDGCAFLDENAKPLITAASMLEKLLPDSEGHFDADLEDAVYDAIYEGDGAVSILQAIVDTLTREEA